MSSEERSIGATLKAWFSNAWTTVKARKWFCTGFAFYVGMVVGIGVIVIGVVDYSSEINVSFNVNCGSINYTYEGQPCSEPFVISFTLSLHSKEGPFTVAQPIYPDKLIFLNGIHMPDSYTNISKLNLTFAMYTHNRTDYSETVNVTLKDIEAHNDRYDEFLNNSEYFTVAISGTKQLLVLAHGEFNDKNGGKQPFVGESEETTFNTIEIESQELYQQYFYTKISVAGVVSSAAMVALPVTYKTLRDIYNKK